MLSEGVQWALLAVVGLGAATQYVAAYLENRLKQAAIARGEPAPAPNRRLLMVRWIGLILAAVACTVVFYVRVVRGNR